MGNEAFDKDLALHLLREHKRGGIGRKDGAAPALRSASWGEVEAYFIARLKALRVRLDGAEQGTPPPPAAVPLPRNSGGG
jgi:hypothetical protein